MSTSFNLERKTAGANTTVLPESYNRNVQDIVTQGPRSRIDQQVSETHPLESRLANWESSQLGMKLHMQRKMYGLHAPLRTMMELQAVGGSPSSPFGTNGAAKIQMDILNGNDDSIDIGDFYGEQDLEIDTPDVHKVLAGKLGV